MNNFYLHDKITKLLCFIITCMLILYLKSTFIYFSCFSVILLLAFIFWLIIIKSNFINLDYYCFYSYLLLPFCILNFSLSLNNGTYSWNDLFNCIIILGAFFLNTKNIIGIYFFIFILFWNIFYGIWDLNSNNFNIMICSAISIISSIIFMFVYRLYNINSFNLKIDKRKVLLWKILISSIFLLYCCYFLSISKIIPEFLAIFISFLFMLIFCDYIRITNNKIATSDYLLLLTCYSLNLQEKNLLQYDTRISILFNSNFNSSTQSGILLILAIFSLILLHKRGVLGILIYTIIITYIIVSQPFIFILYPVLELLKYHNGYHYFPGMLTCLLPFPFAIKCFLNLLNIKR